MLDAEQITELRSERVDPDVGNRVAAAVRLSGETQKVIAQALSMTEPHLSDICRGVYRTVRLDTAQKLAEHFGCAIEDLFPRREKVA